MLDTRHRVKSVLEKPQVVHHGSPRLLTRAGGVTVLLLLLAGFEGTCSVGAQTPDSALVEFSCQFHLPVGTGRLDGLMISDVSRRRIAIYWIEPAMFREAPAFLRCCDLIFDPDTVHYWIQGMSQPRTLPVSDREKNPLLPGQKSAEAILRSALAIVSEIRCSRGETETLLEVAAFFERSRGQTQYHYHVAPREVDGSQSFDSTDSGTQLLNALPYGREYSKETRDGGSVVWRSQKGANGPAVATVAIQGVHELGQDAARTAFDVQTLGHWALIPEAYRTYWSFERALETVRISSDVCTSARDVYAKLNSYLDANKAPAEVSRALDRLRFQAALMTADSNCVWQSAQAVVAGLCADEAVPEEQCVVDLGDMSGRIQKQCPEGMEEALRPLVAHVVRHAGQAASTGLGRLMARITSNGWFTYGELFLAEMRRAGLIDDRDVDSWRARLQASRAAKSVGASDSSEAPASVRQYLSQLDAVPPRGAMNWNDVRRILNEGLAKRYTAERAESKREIVERVIRSLRLIAGEGPFCGAPEKLIPALDRLSRNCLQMNSAAGSLDTVLATFLALSFCDTSTTEDHKRLFSQLQNCSRVLQSLVSARLGAHGLATLVTPEDVKRRFEAYERRFQQCIDDPLWPAFKFPWTRAEEVRLEGALRLRLTQLEPVFAEMALKVEYGGASEELKDKIGRAITAAAQQLLPQAAFLRLPPYPGVGYRYIGGYGFSVAIQGPLYQEGHRPRERFQAMKYFHLGHRLQGVVERERELTLHTEKEEMSK